MELPLLKRELIELAQRRRTYGLRCLVWLVFGIVFVFAYLSVTRRSAGMQVLGRGNDISTALFVTLMMTIDALNPAMACSAITSEKEKQTLGLIILINLVLYGSLLLVVRTFVLRRVSGLLQRPESPVTASRHDEWSQIGSNMG